MRFSDLDTGARFLYGKHKMRMIKIEEVEDVSASRWNAVSDGVLQLVPKRATVHLDDQASTFLSDGQLHHLINLAMDAEILHAVKEKFKSQSLYDWYTYYKENDPKFGEACSWLEHVMKTKGIGTKQYAAAVKKCKRTFLKANEEGWRGTRQLP